MDAGAGTAVRAEGLVKTYPSRSGDIEAVRGVDLTVHDGEVFGFLGPNGAGKSTTVKMLTTLLTITAGRAWVAGVDVAAAPDAVRTKIGVALQEAGLDPRQTGRELLVLQGRLFGMDTPAAAERAGALLALVELEDAADRRIKGYSGGMKRRLDLASALVHEPGRAVPRRADDRARSREPADDLGRGPADQRARDHRLPHHAVPRGGRPALRPAGDHRRRVIVREGTPAQLKADLRERRGLDADPTLDDVFLDATGRTRDRIEGDVQEVRA